MTTHGENGERRGRETIENDDDDIGIPLTFANYTPKIDSPVVHIEKFSRQYELGGGSNREPRIGRKFVE